MFRHLRYPGWFQFCPWVRSKGVWLYLQMHWVMKAFGRTWWVICGLGQWKFLWSQELLVLISFSWGRDISHSLLLLCGIWDTNFLKGMPCYVRETTERQRQEAFFTGGYFEDPKLVSHRSHDWPWFHLWCFIRTRVSMTLGNSIIFVPSGVWTLNHQVCCPLYRHFLASLSLFHPVLFQFPFSQWYHSPPNSTNKPFLEASPDILCPWLPLPTLLKSQGFDPRTSSWISVHSSIH